MKQEKKTLTLEARNVLLDVLAKRFSRHTARHASVSWDAVERKLTEHPEKLWSLNEMERTGGEPDVIGYDNNAAAYMFCDCSAESPYGRRSTCYDREALDSRKEHKPKTSALDMAAAMGIDLLTEEQYRGLQELGEFDAKTSSWILTPPSIRALGGALFCDRRYDAVFVYHNSAGSYYSARGFRGIVRV